MNEQNIKNNKRDGNTEIEEIRTQQEYYDQLHDKEFENNKNYM